MDNIIVFASQNDNKKQYFAKIRYKRRRYGKRLNKGRYFAGLCLPQRKLISCFQSSNQDWQPAIEVKHVTEVAITKIETRNSRISFYLQQLQSQ